MQENKKTINMQLKGLDFNAIKKKIKDINHIQIMEVLLFINLYFTNIANHTIFSTISIIMLCTFTLAYIYIKKEYHFNKYFFFYGLFFAYQIILIILGTVRSTDVVIGTLKTMTVNIVILFVIYNIIMEIKDMKRISKMYVYVGVISLLTIIIALKGDIFSGRLAHAYEKNAVSYYYFGIPIAMTSNYIALFCSISALFSAYVYYKDRQTEYIIYAIFCIIGVLLTGSRKGILLLAIFFICFINIVIKGRTALKIAIFSSLALVGFIAITKIPFLYNIIGERLIQLINHIFGQNTDEGSIVARERYTSNAYKWISNHPILGHGVGTFKRVYKNNTESNYLEMLVSGGIIGLILYYYYLIKSFIKDLLRKNKDDFSKIMLYIIGSVFLIEIGTVTYLSRSYLFLFILFLANIQIQSKDSSLKLVSNKIYDKLEDTKMKIDGQINKVFNRKEKNEE